MDLFENIMLIAKVIKSDIVKLIPKRKEKPDLGEEQCLACGHSEPNVEVIESQPIPKVPYFSSDQFIQSGTITMKDYLEHRYQRFKPPKKSKSTTKKTPSDIKMANYLLDEMDLPEKPSVPPGNYSWK